VDPDSGDSFIYTFVTGEGDTDNSSFSISGDTLQTAKVFDYESKSSYSVRIQTDDGKGGKYSKPFTITVENINESPTALKISNNKVDENASVGKTVGLLSTEDPDSGDSYSYSFVSGEGDNDNSSFSISDDTLVTAKAFNYESKPSYSVRIQTDDGNGGKYSKSFTITVNDVNESPTAIQLSNDTIKENMSTRSLVGLFSTSDQDNGDVHSYQLITGAGDDDNSSFVISGDSLLSAKVFDYETQSTYSVRIETKDTGGKTFSDSFIIIVEKTTGIIENKYGIKLYPNPVLYNRVNVVVPFDEQVKMRVIDVYGKVILERNLGQSVNKVVFDNIPSGLYIVHIFRKNEIIYRTKIIVD
jgi:hypothetical protein